MHCFKPEFSATASWAVIYTGPEYYKSVLYSRGRASNINGEGLKLDEKALFFMVCWCPEAIEADSCQYQVFMLCRFFSDTLNYIFRRAAKSVYMTYSMRTI